MPILFCPSVMFCISCSWLSCPGCSAMAVLFCLSLCLSYSGCPVLAVLFWISWVLTVLFCLSCSACPPQPVLFCLSCSACPVLPIMSWLSCPVCPVMTVLFACPFLPVLFWLSCPIAVCGRTNTKWRARKSRGAKVRAQIQRARKIEERKKSRSWERKSVNAKAQNLRPKKECEEFHRGARRLKKGRAQL
jgi:hypothetical protein